MSCENHNSSSSSEEFSSPKVDVENRQQEGRDPSIVDANNAMRLRRKGLAELRYQRSHHNPLVMGRPMTR